jgi:predicted ATPase
MLVSISGAFSSGKTTLSTAMCASTPGATLLPELVWEVKNVFPDLDWSTQAVRDYFLISQMIREANTNPSSLVICDTGIIEVIAHSEHYGLAPRYELLELLRPRRYNAVFICDYNDTPIEINGVRETNPDLRIRLHKTIVEVAQGLGYQPIILRGSVENRLQEVSDWLSNHQWTV